MPLSDETRQLCSDLFTKLDKNKNGYLEKNEVKKASIGLHSFVAPAARWDWVEMDANKDGVITLAEWLAFFDAKVEPWQGASLTIPIPSKEEGEMLAAITRWCEHEAGLEKEAEAARRVAEEWEKAHPEVVQRIEEVMGAHWEKGKNAEFREEINKAIEPELKRYASWQIRTLMYEV